VPRNVEIKAKVRDLAALAKAAAAIADDGPLELRQDDTFFPCPSGRLKLRVVSENAGELIFYRRPDRRGPKESSYVVVPTSDPRGLRDALALAYGAAGRVIKRRVVFKAGRTRIHLDEVEGLGAFLELEVVLEDGEPASKGIEEAHRIMRALGVEPDHLIEGAYVDLIAHE
jgi:predicted adenylyl cyclase CyaB